MNLFGDKKYTLDTFKTGCKFSCTFHLSLGTLAVYIKFIWKWKTPNKSSSCFGGKVDEIFMMKITLQYISVRFPWNAGWLMLLFLTEGLNFFSNNSKVNSYVKWDPLEELMTSDAFYSRLFFSTMRKEIIFWGAKWEVRWGEGHMLNQ